MKENDFIKSQVYEQFIAQAWVCQFDEHGANYVYMLNLLRKEAGSDSVSHLMHEKLLADVKKYMLGAINYAIEHRKLDNKDRRLFVSYLPRIMEATESSELVVICEEGWERLLKYRPV